MKTKTLHVVHGSSAKVTLEMGKVRDDIVFIPINLSYGYIPKDFSDKELCFALASQNKIDMFDQFKDFITKEYFVYDRVIVWHGWAASDLLLLYLMSTLIEDNLYQITITDYPDFKKRHESAPFVGMDWVCPMDVSEMMSYMRPITKSDLQKYKEQWDRWKETKTPFRFSDIHTGVIEEYPADFMDSTIIDIVQRESQLSRIVGLVMGEFLNLPLHTSWICDRIFKLCNQGKLGLEVKGEENAKTITRLENWIKEIQNEVEVNTMEFELTFKPQIENNSPEKDDLRFVLEELHSLDSTLDSLSDYVCKAKTLLK